MSDGVRPGLYRHYKGDQYEVLFTVRHSETLEELVVYRSLKDNPLGQLWARPRAMFEELLSINGEQIKRFTPLERAA